MNAADPASAGHRGRGAGALWLHTTRSPRTASPPPVHSTRVNQIARQQLPAW